MGNVTNCKPLAVILTIILALSLSVFTLTIEVVGAQSYHPMVSAGEGHTVGLDSGGSVIPLGTNGYGQCTGVLSWTGITQVSAGFEYTVGLKSDGTVVAVGNNGDGQCAVNSWTGIIQVAAGTIDTVGLKSDGTVVATGYDVYGQCSGVSSWTGITQVAAGNSFTVGLKSDGTVMAVGNNGSGQCNVNSWTGITQVAAGDGFTVGLKSDGTATAVGNNSSGQCNVGSWTGITQVAAGDGFTIGMKSDGTVLAVGNNGNGQCNVGSWTGIIQVAAGYYFTVGLKSDGTVVAVGDNLSGQCDVNSWNLLGPGRAATYTSVSSFTNQAVVAQSVTFTATVTPKTASGTIQFMTDGKPLGNAVTLSNGSATSSGITSLAPGNHVITALYSGDVNDAPSIGLLPGGEIVQGAVTSSSTAITSNANPSEFGQPVTFTATVTPGTATGTVQFIVDGTAFGKAVTIANGSASSSSITSLTPGTHVITALYSGDSNDAPSSGLLAGGQTVQAAVTATSTVLTSSLNPSKYGQWVTFTATVTPKPMATEVVTGTVTFKDGDVVLATRSLDGLGQATFTTSGLLINHHTITVVYNGNTSFAASTDTITQIVLNPIQIFFLV
jgi:alpha-tubulin suppressor-like RCC1 family protein